MMRGCVSSPITETVPQTGRRLGTDDRRPPLRIPHDRLGGVWKGVEGGGGRNAIRGGSGAMCAAHLARPAAGAGPRAAARRRTELSLALSLSLSLSFSLSLSLTLSLSPPLSLFRSTLWRRTQSSCSAPAAHAHQPERPPPRAAAPSRTRPTRTRRASSRIDAQAPPITHPLLFSSKKTRSSLWLFFI